MLRRLETNNAEKEQRGNEGGRWTKLESLQVQSEDWEE